MIKASYCAGQAGIDASNEEASGRLLTGVDRTQPLETTQQDSLKRKADTDANRDGSKRRVGDFGGDPLLDRAKLSAAMEAEEARLKGRGDDSKYNRQEDVAEVTEEVRCDTFSETILD